jgi:hypothetical protein
MTSDEATKLEPATIKELLASNNIESTIRFLGYEREESPASEYRSASAFYRARYEVTIKNGKRAEAFSYFCGHSSAPEFARMNAYETDQRRKKNLPKLEGVVWSLAQDASFFANNDALYATYENFADEYGYDRDSRKGVSVYEACRANGMRIRELLGRECFAHLMALINEGIEE